MYIHGAGQLAECVAKSSFWFKELWRRSEEADHKDGIEPDPDKLSKSVMNFKANFGNAWKPV